MPTETLDLWPLQSTAGRFEVVDAHEVRFLSRFPPVPGTNYSLLMDGVEVATAGVPVHSAAAVAQVVAIHPTASEIPLNHLKLYIHFSAPMSEGWAAQSIQVQRASDRQQLAGVLLPMEPELWDHARRRLTLLLDPGRIKRGLAPNEELGYPLDEGVSIIVAVDRSFRDANGSLLLTDEERQYAVGPAIRRHVNPAVWRVCRPGADSTDRLHVEFDRPLDRALLEHGLAVSSPDGRLVEGDAIVAEGDRSWSFTPSRPWEPGVYRLNVNARLEDLAGNSLVRVLDRDLTLHEDAPLDFERAVIEFRVNYGGPEGSPSI